MRANVKVTLGFVMSGWDRNPPPLHSGLLLVSNVPTVMRGWTGLVCGCGCDVCVCKGGTTATN